MWWCMSRWVSVDVPMCERDCRCEILGDNISGYRYTNQKQEWSLRHICLELSSSNAALNWHHFKLPSLAIAYSLPSLQADFTCSLTIASSLTYICLAARQCGLAALRMHTLILSCGESVGDGSLANAVFWKGSGEKALDAAPWGDQDHFVNS